MPPVPLELEAADEEDESLLEEEMSRDTSIKFYCEICDKAQSVYIDLVEYDELNDTPWGDIVCLNCSFVIATISAADNGRVVLYLEPDAASGELRK